MNFAKENFVKNGNGNQTLRQDFSGFGDLQRARIVSESSKKFWEK